MGYTDRAYGIRYGTMEGAYMSAADIAKLMREDIRLEVSVGALPGKPGNYSVRVHNYSGGRSIRIEARDLPDMWQTCDGIVPGSADEYGARACPDAWCAGHNDPVYAKHARTHRTLTVEARRILKILEAIHGAYNHDGSDVMTDYFDVNYYGEASIEDEWHAEYRAREQAKKAAAKQAKKASAPAS